ncbi:hypothetical protein BDV96DRAFT_254738 [Lophiotrema nucula]|uniref:AB hydrolase-1 domain-containing protein n=1 Tax=Lophiotrema nucula TaxID=690887 RepID=A0A6A5YR33_9PLEO|nr:hypothetical protein BDV96DRAFT_254738 [Lophiotrema nucula]
MASTTKPTILFVHGSWHTPAHFAPVRAVFEKAGYPTSCQLFPSVEASPPIGLKEDAQCVKDELSRLIEAGRKDVIVVAHSYGGVVSTEACEKQFNLQERRKKGEKGGIVRIVYLCAFLIPVGKTLEQALGGTMPPWIPEDVSNPRNSSTTTQGLI